MKQIANARNPRIAAISSLKVLGTSSDTTRSVTANANTASLKASMREISCRCCANGFFTAPTAVSGAWVRGATMLVQGFQICTAGEAASIHEPGSFWAAARSFAAGVSPRCRDGPFWPSSRARKTGLLLLRWFLKRWPVFSCLLPGSGGIVDGGAVSSKISLASNSDREKTGKSVIKMQQSGR